MRSRPRLTSVEQASAQPVTTIEGLASGDELSPVQAAFVAEDAMQCGYCTTGMIISATAPLDRSPQPSAEEIRDALAGNLCRCGVYGRAIRAVQRAGGQVDADARRLDSMPLTTAE